MAIVINGSNVHSPDSEDVTQYNGDKIGDEFSHWKLFGTDPNKFITESYGILASRCATLYHTSSLCRAAVNTINIYAIGKGLIFKSTPDFKMIGITPEASKEWGAKFQRLLHYEKIEVNWYQKQSILFSEANITGDAMLYFLREDNQMNRPFDLLVGLGSDIDWTKTKKAEDNKDAVTLGIRHDKYNRRTGYVSTMDGKDYLFSDEKGTNYAVQYIAKKDRAAMLRGLSIYHSEIAHSKNRDRVQDAVIERVVLEATQLGTYDEGEENAYEQAAALGSDYSSGGSPEGVSLEPLTNNTINQGTGGVMITRGGKGLKFSDLKAPSDNYGIFNDWTVYDHAMATEVPPEILMSRFTTSYSGARAALNKFIQVFTKKRFDFVNSPESKVAIEYLKHFVRTGQIDVIPSFWTDYKVQQAYLAGIYLGPVPGHINPLQEVNADIKKEEMGYVNKSDNALKYGVDDFEAHMEKWYEEQQGFYDKNPEQQAELMEKALNKLDKFMENLDERLQK